MTILKHGKYFNKPVIFKCDCGCEFIAERKDYGLLHEYFDIGDGCDAVTIRTNRQSYATAKCPECEDYVRVEINV